MMRSADNPGDLLEGRPELGRERALELLDPQDPIGEHGLVKRLEIPVR